MEQQNTGPINAIRPQEPARPVIARAAEIPALRPQTLPSRYLTWTVMGCGASFVLGVAVGGDGWSVSRGAMTGGLLASALVGGLTGYALGWRTHTSAPPEEPQAPVAPLFQVSQEDVIGHILEPLNELNRELCRDMEAGVLDHRVKGSNLRHQCAEQDR